MSKKRIDAIRKKMLQDNLDGIIVNHLDYVRYLSGYTGSSGLLIIGKKNADFFTDFRYTDQAKKQVKSARIHIIKRQPIDALSDFPQFNVKNNVYGYISEYMSDMNLEKLRKVLPDVLFVKTDAIFEDLGWVKDKDEVANITKACEIADIAFERVLQITKPGVREREIAAELEYQMMMLGAEKAAFETIIASGYRSAMPHGVASSKKIKNGEFVTFDFGATVNGYVSDMTRTVVIGKASSKQKKIYDIVLKAQKAGVRKIKPGVLGKTVDSACRNIITKAGYGKNFGHGTGHGIGFFIHVGPRLSAISDDKLKPNNIITVEPGIYISGWGGVRIEDDVLVTRNGGKVLNNTEKKLLEL